MKKKSHKLVEYVSYFYPVTTLQVFQPLLKQKLLGDISIRASFLSDFAWVNTRKQDFFFAEELINFNVIASSHRIL